MTGQAIFNPIGSGFALLLLALMMNSGCNSRAALPFGAPTEELRSTGSCDEPTNDPPNEGQVMRARLEVRVFRTCSFDNALDSIQQTAGQWIESADLERGKSFRARIRVPADRYESVLRNLKEKLKPRGRSEVLENATRSWSALRNELRALEPKRESSLRWKRVCGQLHLLEQQILAPTVEVEVSHSYVFPLWIPDRFSREPSPAEAVEEHPGKTKHPVGPWARAVP